MNNKVEIGDKILIDGKTLIVYSINYDDPFPFSMINAVTGQFVDRYVLREGNYKILSKKENKMLRSVKEYVVKYKDWFYTLGALFLVDHFVFHGAFKRKIQERVNKVLEKV